MQAKPFSQNDSDSSLSSASWWHVLCLPEALLDFSRSPPTHIVALMLTIEIEGLRRLLGISARDLRHSASRFHRG